MSGDLTQKHLDDEREAVDGAEASLFFSVIRACPDGDDHKPVRHRDGLPPWCHSCGRTDRGMKVKEVDQ